MPDKMQEPDLEAVLNRLESSWQELLQYLRGGAPRREQTIRTEKLVLVDPRGETRAVLGVNADGSSGLVLMDRDGRYRAWLGLKEDGAGYLSLKDQMGRIIFEAPGSPAADAGAPGPLESEEFQAVLAQVEKVGQDLTAFKELLASQERAQVAKPLAAEVRLDWLEQQHRRLKRAGALVTALLLLTMGGLGFLAYRTHPWSPAPVAAMLQPEAGTTAQAAPRPEAKAEPQPQAKVEVKPEEKPEAKTEPQPEAKPEAKPEKQPEAKPEAKPEEKPEPRATVPAVVPASGTPLTTETLVITDGAGKTRARLGTREGAVQLELYDGQGKVRTALGLGPEGEPGLTLYDAGEKPRAQIALTSEDEPGLCLTDDSGLLRVALGKIAPKYEVPAAIQERPVSSLVIFNQEGTPVWRAPLRWRR